MVNRDHPDFPRYLQEWENIKKCFDEEEEKMSELGLSYNQLARKYHTKIRELQTRYAHIFIHESEKPD